MNSRSGAIKSRCRDRSEQFKIRGRSINRQMDTGMIRLREAS